VDEGALEIAGVRWWLGPGGSPESLAPLLARLPAALGGEALALKRGRRKELYRWIGPAPGHDLLVKVSRYERGAGWLRSLRGSKARRELAIARGLAARGLATPLPLAAGELRRRGRLRACYLVVARLDGAVDLAALWRDAALAPRERRELASALGTLAQRLHAAGLHQPDFAPNNFLVLRAGAPELLPVDFERARLCRVLPRAARARMLATLGAHLAQASAAARWRFLRAYAGSGPGSARDWWRRVARAAPGVAAAEWKHLRRTSTRDGRSFCAVTWGGWRGWARRDPGLDALARANAGLAAGGPGRRAAGAKARAELLCWRGPDPGGPRARAAWAAAQLLWTRGRLAPEPLALVRGAGEARLWWRPEPGARSLAELAGQTAERAAALRAASVLLARLLGLGRVSPRGLSPGSLLLAPLPGGRFSAQLLDPEAFRPGTPAPGSPRRGARELLAAALS